MLLRRAYLSTEGTMMASIEYTRTVIRDTVRSAVQYGWSLARVCSEIYPSGANISKAS